MKQSSLYASFSGTPKQTWRPDEPPSLAGVKDIRLDLETTGLQVVHGKDVPIGVAVGYGDQLRYLPTGHKGGNLDEPAVIRWAKQELRDKDIWNFNIKFDAHAFRKWGVDLEAQGCRLHDVSLSAALLNDHLTEFSLEDISQAWLGVGKVTGLRVDELAEYHASEVAPYGYQDISLVDQLWTKMRPRLDAEGLLRVQELEDQTIFAVVEMERNAAPIDREKLDRWVRESEREVTQLIMEIRAETGVTYNRPADAAKIFYARKIAIAYYTPTGAPSFTDEILGMYSDPVVVKLKHLRRLQSLRSKYLLAYQKAVLPSGHLPYQLHQLRGDYDEGGAKGTITGRFSSSNKNIQQVMTTEKQQARFGGTYLIRELFVPENDAWWLSSDAEQIEYRIFADRANAKKLIEAYKKNPRTNFHKEVHEMVKPYKDISYKATKNLNFCKLYGGGAGKVARMLGISEEEAREFVGAYDVAFPEVKRFLRNASDRAEREGFVTTLMGRRARFVKGCKCPACAYSGPRFYKAANGEIQGSAADVMKKKLRELHEARKHTGFKMRFTVHDEVNGDVPDLESARRVDEILNVQTFGLKVPILWKTEVGRNWAELSKLSPRENEFDGTVDDQTRGGRSRTTP